MNDGKTCLVITFNSPYVANIPILLDLYASRFDKIFFLTHKPEGYKDALRIDGKSNYFHNYFLQSLEQIRGYDYYIFTHDDAVLNPKLDKHNISSRFSIPRSAICVRNIDLVPRDSPWVWASRGGYDIVDINLQLKNLLTELHPRLCKNYLGKIIQFHCSKYDDPKKIIGEHPLPLLFGGGANADLIFMPGQAMEELMEKISLLNFPGFFVEIVIPMAILLTDYPIYLLESNPRAPIHYSRNGFILSRLAVLALKDCISLHPIKFGIAHPLALKLFTLFYHLLRGVGN